MNGTQSGTTLSGNTPILVDALDYSLLNGIVIIIGLAILLWSSGKVVRKTLNYAGVKFTDNGDGNTEDTGRAIGKTENVLLLSLMLLEAYTALGVIFAAKSIVRKSDMDREDTSYYLTGTMANFTYSVVIGLALHLSLRLIVTFDVL